MTQPIRILQILGIVAGGGVEAVIMNYYRHIDRTRVQFDFIIHKDSPVDIKEEVAAMGGRVYQVTPYYKNPIAFTAEIYRIIKGGHYHIVHSNMNTLSAFPLLAAHYETLPTFGGRLTSESIPRAYIYPWPLARMEAAA